MVIHLCQGKWETPPPFHIEAFVPESEDEIVSEIPHNLVEFQEKFRECTSDPDNF